MPTHQVEVGNVLRGLEDVRNEVDLLVDKMRDLGVVQRVRVTLSFDNGLARIFVDGDSA
jgi:hypothetical protein